LFDVQYCFPRGLARLKKVKLVDRGKRSAIIFCRMRVLHKTCYVPLSTGQVTAHPPTRKQH
ncbi:hypothetical protein, partial [Escherichia coli]|uniref:hypothetical protein n=1 Tax=Escherichia coli TaxID=562 RepID=UPI001BC866CC